MDRQGFYNQGNFLEKDHDWGEGSILTAYITQSFQNMFISLFVPIVSPYGDSLVQINCGSPVNRQVRY